MKIKKLIQEERIECIDYKEEKGRCFHLGIFSGKCFKFTHPLKLCKEVKKERIQMKK